MEQTQKSRPTTERTDPSTTETAQSSGRSPEIQDKLDDAADLIDQMDELLEEMAESDEPVARTLGDLMRLGSKTTNQAYGEYVNDEEELSCALGAAYLGAKSLGLAK